MTPTSLKSDFSRDISSAPDISWSKNAWQYMGSPTASNHWQTSYGDHCKAISTIQEVVVISVLGNLEAAAVPADIDEVEADPPPTMPVAMPPEMPLDAPPPVKLKVGDLANFGTLNHEFRRNSCVSCLIVKNNRSPSWWHFPSNDSTT